MRQKAPIKDVHRSRILRTCLMVAGIFFVALGTVGIFLPLLPSVKFYVLSAICFARSSESLHHWLLSNKWFGSHIKNFSRGISLRQKISVLSLKILAAGYLGIFVLDHLIWRLILVLVVIGVGIYIFRLPTLRNLELEDKHQDHTRRK
ncbi:MAG: Inner membrane protein YbaN [Dehalococcoidia bacterium]|nr:Inner membrane protein YbaN [Chloroflexota bacterium]